MNGRSLRRLVPIACLAAVAGSCPDVKISPSLSIRRHTTVPATGTLSIDDSTADGILTDARTQLHNVDHAGDVQCDVPLRRTGPVGVFTTGSGAVNSQGDFDDLQDIGGSVKVVRVITYCGFPGTFLGCTAYPTNYWASFFGANGPSMVVIRSPSSEEGILWAHEYGHGRGLDHRPPGNACPATTLVMTACNGFDHQDVNSQECDAYVH